MCTILNTNLRHAVHHIIGLWIQNLVIVFQQRPIRCTPKSKRICYKIQDHPKIGFVVGEGNFKTNSKLKHKLSDT